MPAIYLMPHTVIREDIDVLGHANNLSYLKWMLRAALDHSAAQGWSGEAYRTLGSGWVVRAHQIEYQQPAFEGDQIVVRTWVANLKKVTSLRRYEIFRPAGDNKEIRLVTASTDWAFIDYKSGMPKRIPPEIATAFEIVPDLPGASG